MARLRCPYCGGEFEPRPNVAAIQKCCGKNRCKAKRKADAQAHWVRKTPDYFKGEYRRTRLWLAEHPGYQRRYRATHPDYVRRDNEGRRRRRILARRRADIQDTYRLCLKPTGGFTASDSVVQLAYAARAGRGLRLGGGFKFLRSAIGDAQAQGVAVDLGGGGGISTMRGLATGFGLKMRGLGLDYSITPFGDLGNAQRVSLGMRF